MEISSSEISKIFLVFNTACFGDVLICNSLCQNIKLAFPNSKVVFITDKKWEDTAKYQAGVDEVFVYDKKGIHKGLRGIFKFIKDFPYKKPFVSFITYKNQRNFLIAKLLKSKFTITPIKLTTCEGMQYRHSMMLKKITNKEIKNLPLRFELPEGIKNPLVGEKYVTLCCITKNPIKNMPLDIALDLIGKINSETEYKAVLTGAGDLSANYARDLAERGADFINLVNKTSLMELGAILKGSVALISCDTGTMHYGYSLGVKTVCVFFEEGTTQTWAPKKELYDVIVIDKNQSAENILGAFKKIEKAN